MKKDDKQMLRDRLKSAKEQELTGVEGLTSEEVAELIEQLRVKDGTISR